MKLTKLLLTITLTTNVLISGEAIEQNFQCRAQDATKEEFLALKAEFKRYSDNPQSMVKNLKSIEQIMKTPSSQLSYEDQKIMNSMTDWCLDEYSVPAMIKEFEVMTKTQKYVDKDIRKIGKEVLRNTRKNQLIDQDTIWNCKTLIGKDTCTPIELKNYLANNLDVQIDLFSAVEHNLLVEMEEAKTYNNPQKGLQLADTLTRIRYMKSLAEEKLSKQKEFIENYKGNAEAVAPVSKANTSEQNTLDALLEIKKFRKENPKEDLPRYLWNVSNDDGMDLKKLQMDIDYLQKKLGKK